MRPEVLSHACIEIRIGLSPDQLDRDFKRLHLVKTLGVSGDLLEKLCGHLCEGRGGTGLLAEVVVDDRAEERRIMRLLVFRQSLLKLRSLKVEHPGKLLGALQNSACERLEVGGGEELDELGKPDGGRLGVDRIENTERVDVFRVFNREIDRGRTG